MRVVQNLRSEGTAGALAHAGDEVGILGIDTEKNLNDGLRARFNDHSFPLGRSFSASARWMLWPANGSLRIDRSRSGRWPGRTPPMLRRRLSWKRPRSPKRLPRVVA